MSTDTGGLFDMILGMAFRTSPMLLRLDYY